MLWLKGQSKEAYKKLSEAFELPKIKKHYKPNYKQNTNKDWKYSDESLNIHPKYERPVFSPQNADNDPVLYKFY